MSKMRVLIRTGRFPPVAECKFPLPIYDKADHFLNQYVKELTAPGPHLTTIDRLGFHPFWVTFYKDTIVKSRYGLRCNEAA